MLRKPLISKEWDTARSEFFTCQKQYNLLIPRLPYIKDVEATGEAFSPQQRTSSTSKEEISEFLLFLSVIFALLDPLAWLNMDPIQIRIQNTVTKENTEQKATIPTKWRLYYYQLRHGVTGKQCWASGSACLWASRIQIHSLRYGSGSGSFPPRNVLSGLEGLTK
jgi:hypothetical protein